ncbi:hypothetical protein BDZ94DRAFT_1258752 [Collybia nuda]|uniref:Uncharacterized protein n=1 Tax=Collybia nuda TaxID=64659 RepID=A0A9P6CK22_9AGAR|nr:hypothetical protein BDZ94DRAFT_1258752 [Collybia nuda]
MQPTDHVCEAYEAGYFMMCGTHSAVLHLPPWLVLNDASRARVAKLCLWSYGIIGKVRPARLEIDTISEGIRFW